MLVSLFRKCCIITCEIAPMESSLILILILEFEYLHNTFNKWRTFRLYLYCSKLYRSNRGSADAACILSLNNFLLKKATSLVRSSIMET